MSMKSFIIRVVIFLVLFLSIIALFLLPITVVFEQAACRSKDLDPYSRINFVTECKDFNADLIIIGNSRAKDGYNDALLSKETGLKCLNLGMAGYPFNFQYHIMYKTYIKQNVKPKYIIAEIGPFSFLDYTTPRYTIEMLPYIDREEFKFYYDICPELSFMDQYRIVRYAGKYEEIFSEIWKLRGSEQIQSIAVDNLEDVPVNVAYEKNYLKKKKFAVERDPAIIKVFNSFLDECNAQGIQVVLVCSPIHTTDGLSHFDMEGFWSLIAEIQKGHHVKVLNYQNLYGNDLRYFANSMHLSPYGKYSFTRRIAHDLDSLNIIRSTKKN